MGEIIGQNKLLKEIERLFVNGFPRFTIIQGERGSGKTLIVKRIAEKLGYEFISCGVKIDEIREIIGLSKTNANQFLYYIKDVDKMSLSAKNSLLKVTEEVPKKSIFVLSVENENNLLNTIKSRGVLLKMNDYTFDELLKIAELKGFDFNDEEKEVIEKIVKTPAEIDIIGAYNIIDYYNFCLLVLDNITEVHSANSLKLGDRLQMKDGNGGFDVEFFLNSIIRIALYRLFDCGKLKYSRIIELTAETLNELNISGINKQSTVDNWILKIRNRNITGKGYRG